ncbi:ATP-binding protein [Limibacillus halophilus]|uniref:histidine kinase n=1 Tax=Limibacillus halophilus TaxID=1579333 RepID=A0A839SWS0_9PROT|nr:ATP-binding protein [Limibacillus halophilus]MBB3066499.1 signal transduction histidine kinase [Limibacillus halophilus]
MDRQRQLTNQLSATRARIELSLFNKLSLPIALASFVKSNRDFTEAEFERFATALEERVPGVLSLQLAPDAVVTYITNKEQNAKAIGHDLVADPNRVKEVLDSISRNEFIVAGPLTLIQGGSAIIARLPIFLEGVTSRTGIENFWGFATVLVSADAVLGPDLLGRFETEKSDPFRISVRGKHGRGESGDMVFGTEEDWDRRDGSLEILLPNGSWVIGGTFLAHPSNWLLLILAPMVTGVAVFIGFYMTLSAQERLIQATKDNAKLQAEMLDREKSLALSMISSGVAHEFNNLLMAISSTVDVIKLDDTLSEQTLEDVSLLKGETKRGQRLTQQLLAYSREMELSPQTVKLSQLIAQTLIMARPMVGASITIELKSDDVSDDEVRLDVAEFKGALLNLVRNAQDAMPTGGTIAFSVAGATRRTTSGDEKNENWVELLVVDTGVGMSQEVLSNVLVPFYTTKEVGKGTGLGLPMVAGVVEASKGELSISSIEGKGTTIRILLPAATATLS